MIASKKRGVIGNKSNKSDIQELSYIPMQEKIAALEVPPEISSKIFEEAKNNSKDVATLLATYIVQKEKGKDDERILSNISKYRPGIFATKALGSQEAWINPYYLLKYLEDKDIKILKSRGIF